MIRGYFDLRKIALKVMLGLWASGSKQVLVGSINEILSIVQFGQGASKLQGRKAGGQKKKLRHFGFEATFFAISLL